MRGIVPALGDKLPLSPTQLALAESEKGPLSLEGAVRRNIVDVKVI